ncbi:HNH endonuclease signature motif containing protein [Mycoplasmopsis gallinacea]|uniref:HNH endonuclease n=1 Tax=Mycoplasmopsis gallinacea TaxID=29556 RepID=A0A6H0V3X4_9BACT|nr:HNH endonuclease signature motif containing protein [Mycoplasmopsis gallinacea]QIW62399.1 hypothetical protein GOQ20_03150 [Mycoplasmopsis gallinacea]
MANSNITKEKAEKIWESYYGTQTRVKDFAGRTMNKSAFNNRKSAFGWNIHHVKPISLNGSNDIENTIPVHILSNSEFGDKNSAKVNGTFYQWQKMPGKRTAGIIYELGEDVILSPNKKFIKNKK